MWRRRAHGRERLFGNLANDAAGIAGREDAVRHVARDDAAGADHGAVADAHARQDDRAAADPHVGPDVDRLAEFLAAAQLRVERVHRRIDLHRRPEQRKAADTHAAHVEDDAVEVEEDALAKLDVCAVVAEEGRLHPHRLAAAAEQLAQEAPPFVLLPFARGVQVLAEIARALASRDQLEIERIVEVAGQHLVALGHEDLSSVASTRDAMRRDAKSQPVGYNWGSLPPDGPVAQLGARLNGIQEVTG